MIFISKASSANADNLNTALLALFSSAAALNFAAPAHIRASSTAPHFLYLGGTFARPLDHINSKIIQNCRDAVNGRR